MKSYRPQVLVYDEAASAVAHAAARIEAALRDGRLLGLATGSTMVPLYRTLSDRLRGVRFSQRGPVGIALDEYVGLPAAHPASFSAYLRSAFAEPLALGAGQVIVPDGMMPDRVAAAASHEALIESAGGIDIQLLGLGGNSHIGFNEPGSKLDSRTRDVELAPATRAALAADFGGEPNVPLKAITAGVGTILEARALLMLATGEAKAQALAAALEGLVGPHCPGSALRLHPDAVVICDRAAASHLTEVTTL